MCGIAGNLLAEGSAEASSTRLRDALAAMRHRGPEDGGLALIGRTTGVTQEWGEGCLGRLDGFWSPSLRDEHRREVLLARYRVGRAPVCL